MQLLKVVPRSERLRSHSEGPRLQRPLRAHLYQQELAETGQSALED